MEPASAGIYVAFPGHRPRGVDRRIRLLYRRRKELVVFELPELSLKRKRLGCGPSRDYQVGSLAEAVEALAAVHPHKVIRIVEKAPPDSILQPAPAEHVEHRVFLRQTQGMMQRN